MSAPLHAIGDSHVRLLWDLTDRGSGHWLGPMTMHRVGRDGLPGLRAAREWLDVRGRLAERDWIAAIPPGAVVVWVYGEIDVRCHLVERVERDGEGELVRLVNAYLATIGAFTAATGTRPAVLSVTPAMDSHNAEFPCRGSLDARRRLTVALNVALRERCAAAGAAFVDLYPAVVDSAGGIRAGLTRDRLHLSPAAAPAARNALLAALGESHAARG